MDRRQFLSTLVIGACAGVLPRFAFADDVAGATCRVFTDQVIGRVQADFMGLSYEANQLAHPDVFNSKNAGLIGHVRTLGAKGVLRIGGNSSEFTVWNPEADADLSDIPIPYNPGKKHRRTAVSKEAIDNLRTFLDAVDWNLIYGLNLGMGTPEQAAEEADYVVKTMGDRLLYLQIGNEPDLYHKNGLRPSTYAWDDFYAEWSKFADAVVASTPKTPFAGPDVAGNVEWIKSLSEKAHDRIGLLTGHYYAEGPPTNPAMTIERLLAGKPKLVTDIAKIVDICNSSKLPYRMAECNSCYSGGKTGVSDTFASALWAADYMLQLATAGYLGVNFHGGGNGIYTPIAGEPASGFSARPLYYGLLVAGQFAGLEMVKADFDSQGVNATAYAARGANETRLLVVNKDMHRSITVDVDAGSHARSGKLWRLTAPAVDATSGVTLAGAQVSTDGQWAPSSEERVDVRGGQCKVDVPAASAALLFLG